MLVKYVDNTPIIAINMQRNANLFLRLMLDEVEISSDPITPKKEGRLRQGTLKTVLGLIGEIKWVKEYAAPQEKGVIKGHPIRHYTTPGTGKEYAEKGVKKAIERSENTMRKAGLI